MQKLAISLCLAVLFSIVSCNPTYRAQSLEYQNYRISQEQQKDAEVAQMLRPYSDSVNNSMNKVIGRVEKNLEKRSPESTLGNFVADALLVMAREKFGIPVHASFVNYGGIRLTQLAAGDMTTGKVFELMPFDNILILQKIKGDAFQQFLDLTAARGGWPLSGLTMQIKDKKAVNVMIDGKPLDPNSVYTIANSDYVANGGDNAEMLRVLPQIKNGYLVRDAIFDYIQKFTSQGKPITAKEENRVTNAQ